MFLRRSLRAAVLLVVLALVLPACGGGDDDESGSDSPPVASKQDFPKAGGKTLAQLREGLPPGPVVAPAVSVLKSGEENRLGFGLFDRSRKQIVDAPVALYTAPEGGGPAEGPFLASFESMAVEPEFHSESVENDPEAAESFYVAKLPFQRPGRYELLGVAKLDDRLVAADQLMVDVRRQVPVPDVGEEAPKISTPTLDDVSGDIEKIETRMPPDTMHEEDFADVVGKKPVMLLFSTPALCQVRICGPVNDVAEQVKSQNEGKATWIHMEIYNDNELEKGFREQVTSFGLPTEPWLFAIDADGKVAARLEGAFSPREAEEALKAATGG